MKLAIQETLLPGRTAEAKMERAAKLGFDAVEFWGTEIWKREKEIAQAAKNTGVSVSTVCAGYRGEVLAAEKDQRELALGEIKRQLEVAGRLGAVGVIVVPIFGGPSVPDLTPFADPRAIEDRLLLAMLPELNSAAASSGAYVILEPLNRYETHYLNRVDQAMDLIARSKLSHIKLMCDLFHMNIEEEDIPKAIARAGDLLVHVHLADNNRLPPGSGHTDFKAALTALAEIGYGGYLALECFEPTDGLKGLEASAAFLKECMRDVPGARAASRKTGRRKRGKKTGAAKTSQTRTAGAQRRKKTASRRTRSRKSGS